MLNILVRKAVLQYSGIVAVEVANHFSILVHTCPYKLKKKGNKASESFYTVKLVSYCTYTVYRYTELNFHVISN